MNKMSATVTQEEDGYNISLDLEFDIIAPPLPLERRHYSKEAIIIHLLQGCTIADRRLRNQRAEALTKLGRKAMESLRVGKHAVLVKKKGQWHISRKMVRSLHGGCYIKKTYTEFMKKYCQPVKAIKLIPQ